MERWRGKVALVTGASRGIGASICKELVKHGMTVIGCARNEDRMMALAEELYSSPGKFDYIKCDLLYENKIMEMFEEIAEKYGRIDVCVNNAGFSTNSPLLTGRPYDWRNMLEVNVIALCVCTQQSVELMKERKIKEGQIINICSIGGHKLPDTSAISGFNFYCGTKFMVRAITEGLRHELQNLDINIRVSNISPGLVETEFLSRSLNPEMAKCLYSSLQCLKPKDIADTVVHILQCPPHLDVTEMIVQPVEKRSVRDRLQRY